MTALLVQRYVDAYGKAHGCALSSLKTSSSFLYWQGITGTPIYSPLKYVLVWSTPTIDPITLGDATRYEFQMMTVDAMKEWLMKAGLWPA